MGTRRPMGQRRPPDGRPPRDRAAERYTREPVAVASPRLATLAGPLQAFDDSGGGDDRLTFRCQKSQQQVTNRSDVTATSQPWVSCDPRHSSHSKNTASDTDLRGMSWSFVTHHDISVRFSKCSVSLSVRNC